MSRYNCTIFRLHKMQVLKQTASDKLLCTRFYSLQRRSQWPRGLRRRSAAARLLGLWVRIPPVAWMFVCLVSVVCCQVEVSATSWSLVQKSPTDCGASVCDLETSWMMMPWLTGGGGCCWARNKQSAAATLFVSCAWKVVTNLRLWYY